MRQIKLIFFLSAILSLTAFATNSYFSSSANISGNNFSTGIWTAAKIVINEVYYDVDSSHGDEGKNEWIEIYNAGELSVNLKDWSITVNSGVENISPNKIIGPGEFILIAHDSSTWPLWDDIPSGTKKINYGGSPDDWLDDRADAVVLKDNLGNIVDQMDYIFGIQGHSWERVPVGTGAFVDKSLPTPGI